VENAPWSALSLMAAAEVYIKELGRLKHGRPLYDPEDEVHVGDVGFFQPDTGKFRRLFNIFLDANHPSHIDHGVPREFAPLSTRNLAFFVSRNYFPPQAWKSESVTAREVDIQVPPYVVDSPYFIIKP
jgi:hypothetical protein